MEALCLAFFSNTSGWGGRVREDQRQTQSSQSSGVEAGRPGARSRRESKKSQRRAREASADPHSEAQTTDAVVMDWRW